MKTSHSEGAVIERVDRDSPAQRAGLERGDLIIAIDGVPVHSGTQLRNTIGLTTIGTKVDLTVDRHGAQYQIPVSVELARPYERADRP
jgi:S1-C subfamily serine protease